MNTLYAEVAWALVSSGTQVQPQIILDPEYLPDHLSVSYDYGYNYGFVHNILYFAICFRGELYLHLSLQIFSS